MPAAAATAIPWVDAKPAGLHQGLATPIGSVRPCHREDVQAIYGGAIGPTGGAMAGVIDLVNVSQDRTDCMIQGVPTVQVYARQGGIALTQTSAGKPPFQPVILNPAAAKPSPLSGKAGAWVQVDWRVDDSGTGRCAAGLEYATVMQLLLDGPEDAVVVDYFAEKGGLAASFCPPNLSVGAFQSEPDSPGSVSPRYWKATLDVPRTAPAGAALNYKVTLENVYYRPLEFRDGCPEYIEVLIGPGASTSGKQFFLLNCAGTGVVPPGGSRTFAMVIQIPKSSPAGDYSVDWELDTGLTSYGGTTAAFAVTPQ
jgi:hypothetical protein